MWLLINKCLSQLPLFFSSHLVFFSGAKWPGRGVDHPPSSSARVKERVELYLYSPLWAFVACSRENFTFYLYLTSPCLWTDFCHSMWYLKYVKCLIPEDIICHSDPALMQWQYFSAGSSIFFRGGGDMWQYSACPLTCVVTRSLSFQHKTHILQIKYNFSTFL
jgi:hypothetical protein